MPEAVPNYLQTNADGSVQAVFAGGVLVEENPNALPPFTDVDRTHNITWTRGPGGAVVAQIGDYRQDDINGVGGTHQVIRALNPAGNSAAALDLIATNPGYVPSALRTQVRVGTTNGGSRVLIDDTGKSSFAQVLGQYYVDANLAAGTGMGYTVPTQWPGSNSPGWASLGNLSTDYFAAETKVDLGFGYCINFVGNVGTAGYAATNVTGTNAVARLILTCFRIGVAT